MNTKMEINPSNATNGIPPFVTGAVLPYPMVLRTVAYRFVEEDEYFIIENFSSNSYKDDETAYLQTYVMTVNQKMEPPEEFT